jgi:hypothetical protein
MYKQGDRIEMVLMLDDPHPIPPGTKGTVTGVSKGIYQMEIQLQVKWDNGRTLSVIIPHDRVRKL